MRRETDILDETPINVSIFLLQKLKHKSYGILKFIEQHAQQNPITLLLVLSNSVPFAAGHQPKTTYTTTLFRGMSALLNVLI